MTKTKAELIEEIKVKEAEIKELKKETERLKRYEEYDKAADELRALCDSFVRAGFSEQEAFTLLTKLTVGALSCMKI